MTKQRDLKRLVRDRQLRTGESYVTALRHTLAARPRSVPVVELTDISEIGDALGMRCQIMVSADLAKQIDVTAALRQLRSVLLTTTPDPDFDLLRAVVLRGEQPRTVPELLDQGLRFLVRLRAGIGGVSPNGRIVAFAVAAPSGPVLVSFMVWPRAPMYQGPQPTLVITTTDFSLEDEFEHWEVLPLGYFMGLP